MDEIFLNWLKLRVLNCKIPSPQSLKSILDREACGMCTFEVTPEWVIKVYDESSFIKSYFLKVQNSIVKSVEAGLSADK